MRIHRFFVIGAITSMPIPAFSGQMTLAAPKIAAESMEPKYSEAATKATQAFLIQSKVGAQLDAIELYATKRFTFKAKEAIGDGGAEVVGASAFLIKCIIDKKVTTKVVDPFTGQHHLLSVGVDGLEISGIRSSIGSSHWFRVSNNEKEGNRYATGLNFSF